MDNIDIKIINTAIYKHEQIVTLNAVIIACTMIIATILPQ